MEDAPRGKLSPEGEKAFERMWSIQLKEGPDARSLAVVRLRPRPVGNEGSRVLWRGAGRSGHRLGSGGLSVAPGHPAQCRCADRLSARGREARRCITGCFCCGRPRSSTAYRGTRTRRRFWRNSGANRKPMAAGHWRRSVHGTSTTLRRLRSAQIAMRPRWRRSPWNRPG